VIPVKTDREIEKMRRVCKMAAVVLNRMLSAVKSGVTTEDLDQIGYNCMRELGCESASYGYRLGQKTFPSYTCISVNDELVHGIPSKKRVIREGDIVSIDVAVRYDGYVGDNARTVAVGVVDTKVLHLLKVAEEALFLAIKQARPGKFVGDISHAIQSCAEGQGFSVVREFVGHGIGKQMHEEPQIPNYGVSGTGAQLCAGMTLAIETMICSGNPHVETAKDGWTIRTKDQKPCAHFEHTVLLKDHEPEILTIP
jgi:methionyl aminopeptidase